MFGYVYCGSQGYKKGEEITMAYFPEYWFEKSTNDITLKTLLNDAMNDPNLAKFIYQNYKKFCD